MFGEGDVSLRTDSCSSYRADSGCAAQDETLNSRVPALPGGFFSCTRAAVHEAT